jgi:hypothetical protein
MPRCRRQQLEQHVGGRILRLLAPFALDPLAIVVEVRHRAQELFLQRVAFLLQLDERFVNGGAGIVARGFRLLGGGFVAGLRIDGFGVFRIFVTFVHSDVVSRLQADC